MAMARSTGESQSLPQFSGCTAGDFNGDGVTDLALSLVAAPNSLYTSVQILLGGASGSFTQGAALPWWRRPARPRGIPGNCQRLLLPAMAILILW